VKYLTCNAVGTDAMENLHVLLLLVGRMKIIPVLRVNSVRCFQIFTLCPPRI